MTGKNQIKIKFEKKSKLSHKKLREWLGVNLTSRDEIEKKKSIKKPCKTKKNSN